MLKVEGNGMKKQVTSLKSLVFLMGVVLSIGAFGETNYSYNVGGLLKIDSKTKNTLVSVPWVCFTNDESVVEIDIDTLVKKRNLVDGDIVMAVDFKGFYESWELEDGEWKKANTIRRTSKKQETITVPEAAERLAPRGIGLWIQRVGEGADWQTPVYVGGQYVSGEVETVIAGGAENAPAWTLLSNPFDEDVDLNEKEWNGKPLATDEIFVTHPGGSQQVYTWKNGAWGYSVYVEDEATGLKRQKRVKEATVSANCGFWYVRMGEAFAFKWN